ncbi:hypothetical protein OROMI_016081 [Orobanche minor]
MVYDWVKEELRELAVYDIHPSVMRLLSYVKNEVALPDAEPIDGEKTVLSQSSSGTVLESKVPLKRCWRRCCQKIRQMQSPLMV